MFFDISKKKFYTIWKLKYRRSILQGYLDLIKVWGKKAHKQFNYINKDLKTDESYGEKS